MSNRRSRSSAARPLSTMASELRDGWVALLAAFTGFALSPMYLMVYSFGLFIAPLSNEFNWSRSEMGLTLTISGLLTALVSPPAGWIADRYGTRYMVPLSMLLAAGCFAAFSRFGPDVRYFWLGYAVLGTLIAGCSTMVFTRIVSANFTFARGTALGLAFLGTGVCAILTPLLVNAGIERFSWRTTYLLIGMVTAGAAVPMAILLASNHRIDRQRPLRPSSQAESGALRRALSTREFWLLATACLCLTAALTGMVPQFVPILEANGISASGAAAIASFMGAAVAGGRMFSGFLADRFFAPRVAALFVVGGTAGSLLLMTGASEVAWLAALAIGLAFGAEIDLAGYIASRYFGTRNFGVIYGFLYIFIVIGSSASHMLYGAMYDLTGGYFAALVAAIALLLCSIVCFLAMPGFSDLVREDTLLQEQS
ncbi:MFS transporter [Novosphingobium pentaromativorans]|nr:MFS transporter [Novosphingobium pentaromativorans]